MTDTVGIDLTLNAQQYAQSAGLAYAQTSQLNAGLAGLATALNANQQALTKGSPQRSHIAAFGGFAAAAAQSQRELSGFNATQAITGQSTAKLSSGIKQLARDMPVGDAAARSTVQTFTQLGVSMAGQEKRAIALSKSMLQLQGANGGFAPQYAQSMAQLERTFGDQGLDPQRVSKTADSLTTVSKTMGANAQSVLDFSNAIGPMAQASGIGKTATLGISAAFSRIGQDGNYAATAVNKILQDMSASVAGGGGGNLGTYASIVGTTADNFERLFKSNPAQAITAVTQAIGQAGPQGPSMLNRLGLEGVRTQNALQAISASGGLQQAIQSAVTSYGSGSTKKASDASFNNVLDNFSKAGTAAGQLGVALGEPLLRPLGTLASALSHVAGGVAGFMGTGVGHGLASTVAYGGLSLLATRRLFGIGTTAAVARQVGTSGPIGSFVYGMRNEMGAAEQRDAEGRLVGTGRPGSVWNRTSGYMGRAQEEGRLNQGFMGPINTRVMALGQGVGRWRLQQHQQSLDEAGQRYLGARNRLGEEHPLTQQYASRYQDLQEGGPGRVPLRTRVSQAFGLGMQGYANVTRAGLDMANEPDPTLRSAAFSRRMGAGLPTGAFSGVWGAFRGRNTVGPVGQAGFAVSGSGEVQQVQQMGKLQAATEKFSQNIAESNKAFPSFIRGLGAVVGMTGAGVKAGPDAIDAAGRGGMRNLLGRGFGSIARGIGGIATSPTFLLTAGLAGGEYLLQGRQHAKQEQRDEQQRQRDLSPTAQIDKYNEALGLATTNTEGFANQMTNAAHTVATNTTTMADALKVGTSAMQQAQAVAGQKPIEAYAKQATPPEIAAQLRQSSPGGLQPQQVAGIRNNLINQYGQTKTQQILSALNIRPDGSFGPANQGGGGDIDTLVGEAGRIPANISGAPDTSKISPHDLYHFYDRGVKLKQSASDITDTVVGGISQRFGQQSQQISPALAQQNKIRDIQRAMLDAAKTGNEAVVRQLNQQLAPLLGVQKAPQINSEEILKNGYIPTLAKYDKGFAANWQQMQLPTNKGGQGISLSGPGVDPRAQLSLEGQAMKQYSLLFPAWNNTAQAPQMPRGSATAPGAMARGPDGRMINVNPVAGPAAAQFRGQEAVYQAGQKMQATMGFTDVSSGDPMKKTTAAVEEFTHAIAGAGGNLGELAAQSQKAMIASQDETSVRYQRAQAIQQEAQFQQQSAAPGRSSGASLGMNMADAAKIINAGPGTTQSSQANYQNARQAFQQQIAQFADMVKQQASMERNYQIQSGRAQQDYQTQRSRAVTDFQTQQRFAYEDYIKQRTYAEQDYFKQSARQQRDFQRQTQRSEQDYQLQMQRSEQDFNTQRGREQRDFNIQMTRGQDDYLTQRGRAIRDFNIQLKRQIEDQTRSLYDPYKRIQTQAVWDGQQLVANMAEQNQAITKQNSQLAQVRKMGLSNASIEQLGLNDPKNAQQLSKLVDDFLTDPKLVKSLNNTTKARASIGKLLLTDPSNVDIQRAKDDFNKSLSDMAADYRKQVARARHDMAIQMADQEADFGKSMGRMTQDFNINLMRGLQDFNIAMSDASYDFSIAMQRQDDAYATSVKRSELLFNQQLARMDTDFGIAMGRMRQDVDESEKELTISLTNLWDTANKLIQHKTIDTNNMMKSGLKDTIGFITSGNNIKDINKAYKNILPANLKDLIDTSGGPDAGHMPPFGGPDAGHMPIHGGPYAPYGNGARNQFNDIFAGARTGSGIGTMVGPSTITQGFGERRDGEANTGGGWPVAGPTITTVFGANPTANNPGGHPGIDLAVPGGTPIHAPLPGVVIFTGWNDGYGNCVIMDNGGGRSTLYGHQQAIATHAGDVLKPGDLIGWVDSTGQSTGNHLHFETRVNGHVQNPAIDLPQWEATAGLGSFDPGSVLASYGLGSMAPVWHKPKLSDLIKHNRGPWGAYVQLAEGLKSAADDYNSQAASNNLADAAVAPYKGTGDMLDNARIIADVAKEMGLGRRGAEIGIVTSLAEATLRNLNYGDRDSLGLFQQRPSQGWGSPAQILDPRYAARKFFSTMLSMAPGWQTGDIGAIAQTVQRSGFPGRYDQQLGEAESILKQIGMSTGGIATKPTLAVVGEGADHEAVIPLNNAGVAVLAQAFGMAISANELRTMTGVGPGERVTYVHSEQSEDHSVTINADKLEVVDPDPISMARKLEAQGRAARLTKRPGRS